MTILPEERGEKSYQAWRIWRFPLAEPLVLFLVLFFPGYLGSLGRNTGPDFSDPLFLLGYLIIAIPQILLLLIIIGKKGENSFIRFGIPPFKVSRLISALPLALVVTAISVLIALPFSLRDLSGTPVLPGPWQVAGPALFPLIIIINIATGYREELFFRSYLLHELAGTGNSPGSAFGIREMVVSSLLFSLGHAYQGIHGLLTTFILSLLLSIRFRRKRDLHEVALAHGLYNTLALLLVSLAS